MIWPNSSDLPNLSLTRPQPSLFTLYIRRNTHFWEQPFLRRARDNCSLLLSITSHGHYGLFRADMLHSWISVYTTPAHMSLMYRLKTYDALPGRRRLGYR
ncbi:hypothetical protein PMIN06_011386 [Paraphaeosphaeria minitans]